MARRKQSSQGFNLDGFDGVDLALDLGEAIDRWRDEFVRTVGMTRILIAVALAAALCIGACAPRVDTTASVAPHVELTLGAAAAPVTPPPPTVVRQQVLVVPQVPLAWRKCPDVPPVLADAATQDEQTVWTLDTRYVAQACKANLGSVDALLTKAEADARRGKR